MVNIAVPRVVFVNSRSTKLKPELDFLSERVRLENSRVFRTLSNHPSSYSLARSPPLVLPIFENDAVLLGDPLPKIVSSFVKTCNMYIQPVGDGFGDLSFKSAINAYRTAEEYNIPRLVIVKKEKGAKSQEFSKRFVHEIGDLYVEYYQTPKQFCDVFYQELTRRFGTLGNIKS